MSKQIFSNLIKTFYMRNAHIWVADDYVVCRKKGRLTSLVVIKCTKELLSNYEHGNRDIVEFII